MTRIAFNVHHPVDRERLQQLAFVIADGSRVEIKPPKRTDEQNARLWWMLGQIASQVEWYGQKLAADDWKVMFTASLRQSRVVPGIDPGTFVVLGLQTSDMGVTEFANLIELATAFAAERGVVFPERRAA